MTQRNASLTFIGVNAVAVVRSITSICPSRPAISLPLSSRGQALTGLSLLRSPESRNLRSKIKVFPLQGAFQRASSLCLRAANGRLLCKHGALAGFCYMNVQPIPRNVFGRKLTNLHILAIAACLVLIVLIAMTLAKVQMSHQESRRVQAATLRLYQEGLEQRALLLHGIEAYKRSESLNSAPVAPSDASI